MLQVGVADDNIIVGKEIKMMEVYVKTKKKIGLFVIIVAALAIMMIGFRWFFFEVLKSDQMLDGLVEFRASIRRHAIYRCKLFF